MANIRRPVYPHRQTDSARLSIIHVWRNVDGT